MQKMKKKTKKYNLALRKLKNDKGQLLNFVSSLNMISQTPENASLQDLNIQKKVTNIFRYADIFENKAQSLNPLTPFNMICQKEIEAYKSRVKRTKNIGLSGVFRMKASQSILSSSRQTGTFGELTNNLEYLTKDELVDFCYTKKEQEKRKENSFSQLMYKNSQSERYNQKQSTHRIEGLPYLYLNRTFNSLENRKIQNWKKSLRLKPLLNQQIDTHRRKVEDLERRSLKRQKQNISPVYWKQNLRDCLPLKNILNAKYVEHIQRQGIRIQGENKLQKELNWIKNKKMNYFESLENKQKYKRVHQEDGEESRILKSYIGTNPHPHAKNNSQSSND